MKVKSSKENGFNLFYEMMYTGKWKLEGLKIVGNKFIEFEVEGYKEEIREFILKNNCKLECGVITDLNSGKKIWMFYRKFDKLIWESINF